MSYTFAAPPKDPQASLDYEIDWSGWLADGEAIADYDVTAEGITVSGVSESDGVVRFRAAGGTAGLNYLAVVTIGTSAGNTDQRTIRIPVRGR